MNIKSWLKSLRVPGKPNEYEVKRLLHSYGISVPSGTVLEGSLPGKKEAVPLPELQPPYAVKICSAEILHKTEEKGVYIGIGEDGLEETAALLRDRFPGEQILVEEMVSYSAQEFIIGGMIDPLLGPAVMVGAGGILTELYRDVAFRLVPCTKHEAEHMLEELTISPLLNGYRGLQIDPESLAEVISVVSGMIEDLGDAFNQLDINPIVYAGGSWTALDAKLICTG